MLLRVMKLPFVVFSRYQRNFEDIYGSKISSKWVTVDKKNITTVDETTLKDILKIFNQNFPHRSEKKLIHYSQLFRHIFYVIQYEGKSIGYCSYYIKPILSQREIKKTAVVFSIGIDQNFLRKGFGEVLLKESIKELIVNNIELITLFVNAENKAAIGLYNKVGFEKISTINDMYGKGKSGYKMTYNNPAEKLSIS